MDAHEMPGGLAVDGATRGDRPDAAGSERVWSLVSADCALDVSIGDTITMAWPPVGRTVVGSGRAGFQGRW